MVLATAVASGQRGGSSENKGASSASFDPPPPPPSEIAVTRPAPTPSVAHSSSESATTKRGPLRGRFAVLGGDEARAPTKRATPTITGPIADRAGFNMGTEGSKVFVEFSNGQPAGPKIARAKGVITVTFTGAAITKRNNENPLITSHFNTPVAETRLTVPAGGSVSLVIKLRKRNVDVDINTGWLENTALKTFAVVFPKGTYYTEPDIERPRKQADVAWSPGVNIGHAQAPSQPAGSPPPASTAKKEGGRRSGGGSRTGPRE